MAYSYPQSLQIGLVSMLMLIASDRTVLAQIVQPTTPPATTDTNISEPADTMTGPAPETPTESTSASSEPSDSLEKEPSDTTSEQKKAPRKLKNFIGIGGNIGVSGNETGLSGGAAALMTRKDLNDRLSIRGVTTFFGKKVDNTVALTVNFPIRSQSKQVRFVPFVGGGVLISSDGLFDDVRIRGLVTGGIDIPISRRISATTSVNVGFTDDPQVGVQIGIGYNF
jgi:hypothetical protein